MMKIEVGKKYISNSGEVIHIEGGGWPENTFHGCGSYGSNSSWHKDGRWIGNISCHDLIEEIKE